MEATRATSYSRVISDMLKHLNIKIGGEVQGVSFRFYARKRARELGLAGFVRNEAGGGVYIEVEGEAGELRDYVEWCRRGPARARVEEVKTEEGNFKNFSEFHVER